MDTSVFERYESEVRSYCSFYTGVSVDVKNGQQIWPYEDDPADKDLPYEDDPEDMEQIREDGLWVLGISLVFHLFCIAGTVLQFVCIFFYVI